MDSVEAGVDMECEDHAFETVDRVEREDKQNVLLIECAYCGIRSYAWSFVHPDDVESMLNQGHLEMV